MYRPVERLHQASNVAIRHFLLAMSVILMACEPGVPSHRDFLIGMTRAEILDKFGEPTQTQTLIKTGEPIWGPIEEYWPQVPAGATVEIWSYDSRIDMTDNGKTFQQAGQTQLYFVNESSDVTGIGFHIKGAVY